MDSTCTCMLTANWGGTPYGETCGKVLAVAFASVFLLTLKRREVQASRSQRSQPPEIRFALGDPGQRGSYAVYQLVGIGGGVWHGYPLIDGLLRFEPEISSGLRWV